MIVEKVRQHIEKEREKGGPFKMFRVVERTAIATGLAVRTVFNIKKYAYSRVRINLDSFDRVVIRRVVHGFYLRKEFLPSPKYWGRSRKLVHFQVVSSTFMAYSSGEGFCVHIKRNSERFIYKQEHVHL